ncbi:VP1 [California sea lion polyomavirus 1]|uniref:Major capsid protein VP1 n=1 Tax=California sea lion polyomavirus 1 TaxID=715223 RepID=D3IZT3_9POLY|nr:VP1 [California sea lion polyomavirus 1]ADC34409.1 VP1 [California sea lion polyomavirus 1]
MKRTFPKRSKGAPPSQVPKLLIKGGIEVLDVRTGGDSITTIELFLNPRVGTPTEHEFGFSGKLTVATSDDDDKPGPSELPCYSLGKVQLPMLNEDMTGEKILMWEAVSCKTEVVGVGSLCNVHSLRKRIHGDTTSSAASQPIVGLNYHFFSVGGEPLQLQFLTENYKTKYEKYAAPVGPLTGLAQVLDPRLKGILDKDGLYPVECWHPDPAKNENSRYFGTYTGGTETPPVMQITNSMTTILLDENGVGPLCKGDNLFLSCCDIAGFKYENANAMKFRGFPRYFSVTLRKRQVKNPYPVGSLLNSLFNKLTPEVDSQPMLGEHSQVEEVRVYQGTEPLPGDPDLERYIDKYGQQETKVPDEKSLIMEINKLQARLQYVRQTRGSRGPLEVVTFPYKDPPPPPPASPQPPPILSGHARGPLLTVEDSRDLPGLEGENRVGVISGHRSPRPLPALEGDNTGVISGHATGPLETIEDSDDATPSTVTHSNVVEFSMES